MKFVYNQNIYKEYSICYKFTSPLQVRLLKQRIHTNSNFNVAYKGDLKDHKFRKLKISTLSLQVSLQGNGL